MRSIRGCQNSEPGVRGQPELKEAALRTIHDSDGRAWQVEETGTAYGAGARGPGGAFPKATFAGVVFTCEDGRTVNRTLGVGRLEEASEGELRALLEEDGEEEEG